MAWRRGRIIASIFNHRKKSSQHHIVLLDRMLADVSHSVIGRGEGAAFDDHRAGVMADVAMYHASAEAIRRHVLTSSFASIESEIRSYHYRNPRKPRKC